MIIIAKEKFRTILSNLKTEQPNQKGELQNVVIRRDNIVQTCDTIFVSRALRPTSRDPAIYINVLVLRFKMKTI